MDKFNYLEVMMSKGEKVAHRVHQERKVWRTMPKGCEENMISKEVKRELYERGVIPAVVYGSKT